MPITKSARKALRRDKRRTAVNSKFKTKMRLMVKKARSKPTKKNLSAAYSVLDMAAKKKLIHKNKAARWKSRLAS